MRLLNSESGADRNGHHPECEVASEGARGLICSASSADRVSEKAGGESAQRVIAVASAGCERKSTWGRSKITRVIRPCCARMRSTSAGTADVKGLAHIL
jgi:hypothetical protein